MIRIGMAWAYGALNPITYLAEIEEKGRILSDNKCDQPIWRPWTDWARGFSRDIPAKSRVECERECETLNRGRRAYRMPADWKPKIDEESKVKAP